VLTPRKRGTFAPVSALQASAEDTTVTLPNDHEGRQLATCRIPSHTAARVVSPVRASARELRKCTTQHGPNQRQTPAPIKEPDSGSTVTHAVRLNPLLGLTSWFHPFTYKRFHVLLNSLFKVLCNFPSRYLFAIGHKGVFSLSSSLRAALGCTLKQPDSIMSGLAPAPRVTAMGLSPTLGKSPCQRNLRNPGVRRLAPRHTRSTSLTPCGGGTLRWAFPFSLAVTRGIPFGFFSSAE